MIPSSILFLCGGTFNGLDKIIRNRIGSKVMGFEADIKGKGELDINQVMSLVQPEDLVRFGLIPEFVGRIPILTTLNELSLEALVRILTEPKNAPHQAIQENCLNWKTLNSSSPMKPSWGLQKMP